MPEGYTQAPRRSAPALLSEDKDVGRRVGRDGEGATWAGSSTPERESGLLRGPHALEALEKALRSGKRLLNLNRTPTLIITLILTLKAGKHLGGSGERSLRLKKRRGSITGRDSPQTCGGGNNACYINISTYERYLLAGAPIKLRVVSNGGAECHGPNKSMEQSPLANIQSLNELLQAAVKLLSLPWAARRLFKLDGEEVVTIGGLENEDYVVVSMGEETSYMRIH